MAGMSSLRLTDRQLRIFHCIRSGIGERGFPPTVREIAASVGLSSPSSVHYQLDMLERMGLIQRDARHSRAIEITELGAAFDAETGRIMPESAATATATLTEPAATAVTQNLDSPAALATLPTAMAADDPAPRPAPAHVSDARSDIATLTPSTASTAGYSPDFSRDAVIAPLVGTIAAGAPILAEQYVEDTFPLPRQLTGSGELFVLRVKGESMIEAAICDGDYVVVRQQHVAEQGEIVAAMIDGEATVKVLNKRDGHIWLMPRNAAFEPIPGDQATILGRVVSVLRAL